MQKLLSKTSQQARSTLTMRTALRSFASSPQPNPYDKSVKTTLSHGSGSHNYYKLPSLQDNRICKS